jgi:hypothetical protein
VRPGRRRKEDAKRGAKRCDGEGDVVEKVSGQDNKNGER